MAREASTGLVVEVRGVKYVFTELTAAAFEDLVRADGHGVVNLAGTISMQRADGGGSGHDLVRYRELKWAVERAREQEKGK